MLEGRENGGVYSAESSKFANSCGGVAWYDSSSLAALRSTLVRGNREGSEGFL
jgi:hypothetical protein